MNRKEQERVCTLQSKKVKEAPEPSGKKDRKIERKKTQKKKIEKERKKCAVYKEIEIVSYLR